MLRDLKAPSPSPFEKKFPFGFDDKMEFRPKRLDTRLLTSHTEPPTSDFKEAE